MVQAGPKRPVPDYDGRGNVDSVAHRGALWLPKILLWPVATVHEYVIRKPLGALFRTAEHQRWAARVRDFVTFGPGKQSFLVPTAVYEFGFKPSVGLFLQLSDLGVRGHDVRIHGATWGPSWLSGVVVDRYTRGRTAVSLRGSVVRRPDFLFLGIGPTVTKATRSRYGRERLEASAVVTQSLGNESRITATAGVQSTSFREGGYGTDPSLDDRITAGQIATPPGYGESYETAFQRLDLVLDTRQPRPATGTGGYLELHGQSNLQLDRPRGRWLEYGGVIGGAVDVDDRQRTITVEVGANFVDPVREQVPFDQLAVLDPYLMPGFLLGWATGRSSFAAQVAYTWPVAIWVDGALRLSVGNAFGTHLAGFAGDQLRLSLDVGLASIGARDSGFELAVGVGTQTFGQGAAIDSVRIALRSRRGL